MFSDCASIQLSTHWLDGWEFVLNGWWMYRYNFVIIYFPTSPIIIWFNCGIGFIRWIFAPTWNGLWCNKFQLVSATIGVHHNLRYISWHNGTFEYVRNWKFSHKGDVYNREKWTLLFCIDTNSINTSFFFIQSHRFDRPVWSGIHFVITQHHLQSTNSFRFYLRSFICAEFCYYLHSPVVSDWFLSSSWPKLKDSHWTPYLQLNLIQKIQFRKQNVYNKMISEWIVWVSGVSDFVYLFFFFFFILFLRKYL